jgi:hypothetical protein
MCVNYAACDEDSSITAETQGLYSKFEPGDEFQQNCFRGFYFLDSPANKNYFQVVIKKENA